jgi:hypothetical protein
MQSNRHLSVVSSSHKSLTSNTDWDRSPDPQRARRLRVLEQRRKRVVRQARRLFSIRTLGSDDRIMTRLEHAAALYRDFNSAVVDTLEIELL